MREAVIVSAVRTPIGRARNGVFSEMRPEDLGAAVIREALKRARGWPADRVDDCVMGCSAQEGMQGHNLARQCALMAGLPASVPAVTVNRSCVSGLQAVAMAAWAVGSGAAEAVVAGGVDSVSRTPGDGLPGWPHPELLERLPAVFMAAGHAAETVARRYGVSREAQDRYAAESHRKAADAAALGRFAAELVPLAVMRTTVDEEGRPEIEWRAAEADENVRADVSPEMLAAYPSAWSANGTVTEGNAAPDGDGAAALLVTTRELANRMGARPLAVFRGFAAAGTAPEIGGIGPFYAVPKALAQAGAALRGVSLWEIGEAFAAESAAVIDRLGVDPDRVNVNGGAIALGHPPGCAGARQVVTLLHELLRRGGGIGVAAAGAKGGMGAAGVFEAVG